MVEDFSLLGVVADASRPNPSTAPAPSNEQSLSPEKTALLPLGGGCFAKVDADLMPFLSLLRWHPDHRDAPKYAVAHFRGKSISLHRYLLDPPPGLQVDHINGDGLDNRLCNLRLCTCSQNHYNCRKRKDNSSGFRGVHLKIIKPVWVATIKVEKKLIYLGQFQDRREAARAYDAAAIKYHGEFAVTNADLGLLD